MPEETKKPEIDKEDLKERAQNDPKSKRYNNPNSRKNLKQYQDSVVPEVISEEEGNIEDDVSAIVIGRKLNPEIVRKLMPPRGVLTIAERTRYVGIVQQYLGDFRNEEPTAADVDDVFEIAMSGVMEARLYKVSKDSPDALVNINQTLERIYKRKQSAKENLSARRSDRKDARASQDINIVDLTVRYDLVQKKRDEDRVADLLAEEEVAQNQLTEVLEKDG